MSNFFKILLNYNSALKELQFYISPPRIETGKNNLKEEANIIYDMEEDDDLYLVLLKKIPIKSLEKACEVLAFLYGQIETNSNNNNKSFQRLLPTDILILESIDFTQFNDRHTFIQLNEALKKSFLYTPSATGRASELVFYTADFKYVIKICLKSEFENLKDSKEEMCNYIKNNPDTYIPKYVKAFSYKRITTSLTKPEDKNKYCSGEITYVLVMNNIFKDFPDDIYDLKGLYVEREQIDYMKFLPDKKIHHQIDNLEQLNKDCEFLCKIGAIDYSLVIALKGNISYIGIVDTLTRYTFDKKILKFWRKILCQCHSSTTDPETYKNRIMELGSYLSKYKIDKYSL